MPCPSKPALTWGNRVNGRNSGGTGGTCVSGHGLTRSPGNCDAEPSKIMGSQARCARRRIAVLCLAIRLWSGCQAGNFLCTETARGRRRTTEKSPPPTQCRQRRRDKMLPASPDRCAIPPLRQSTAMANPKSPAVSSPRRQPSDSPWRFVVLRLPP